MKGLSASFASKHRVNFDNKKQRQLTDLQDDEAEYLEIRIKAADPKQMKRLNEILEHCKQNRIGQVIGHEIRKRGDTLHLKIYQDPAY